MSSINIITDADLKSRLAFYGIVCPITNTTRNILLNKLIKLDMENNPKTVLSPKQTNSFSSNEVELMVS